MAARTQISDRPWPPADECRPVAVAGPDGPAGVACVVEAGGVGLDEAVALEVGGAAVVGAAVGGGGGDVAVGVAAGAVAVGVAAVVLGDSGNCCVSVGGACPCVAPAAVEVTAPAASAIPHKAIRTPRTGAIAAVKRRDRALNETGRHTSTPELQATPSG